MHQEVHRGRVRAASEAAPPQPQHLLPGRARPQGGRLRQDPGRQARRPHRRQRLSRQLDRVQGPFRRRRKPHGLPQRATLVLLEQV